MRQRLLAMLVVGAASLLVLANFQASLAASGPPIAGNGNPPGARAIPIRFHYTANGAQPNYTLADAQDYALHQGGYFHATIAGPPDIIYLRFMPGADVDQILNSRIGLDPRALVCFVVLHNTAIFGGPSAGPPVVEHYLYEIFDAYTGNLLADGGVQNFM